MITMRVRIYDMGKHETSFTVFTNSVSDFQKGYLSCAIKMAQSLGHRVVIEEEKYSTGIMVLNADDWVISTHVITVE